MSFIFFNRSNGSYIPYTHIQNLASASSILIRTGCFCNPGACSKYLSVSTQAVKHNLLKHGHACGDEIALIDGKPTGSVRISFGINNRNEDVGVWIDFLIKNFIELEQQEIPLPDLHEDSTFVVSEIIVYPIKSCAGYRVECTWPISEHGLLYDRQWMLIDDSGIAITQKRNPKIALIHVSSITRTGVVEITFFDGSEKSRLGFSDDVCEVDGDVNVRFCGDRYTQFFS